MSKPYLRRIVDQTLDTLLREAPAISIEGARAVGKTATASRRAATAYFLDTPGHRVVAEADPSQLLRARRPILIDEWQRVPSVWDAVRREVDRGAAPGSFILTGSSNHRPGLTHTGAGRVVSLRMHPLSLAERESAQPSVSLTALLEGSRPAVSGHTSVTLADYVREIVQSGFPGLRSLSGRAHRAHLDGYVRHLIDEDFPVEGLPARKPHVLERWLAACAAATATVASYETIRDAATPGVGERPARTTVRAYQEVLERLWILDSIPAWLPSRNFLTRLGGAPKHHLADPSLAARLLGLGDEALLGGAQLSPGLPAAMSKPSPVPAGMLGQLFESLVTLSVRVYASQSEARVRHLRVQSGRHEIDIILERADGRVVALEVKLGSTVSDDDVRHLKWLQTTAGDTVIDAVVVNTGSHAYRRPDGIAVVPAALLGV